MTVEMAAHGSEPSPVGQQLESVYVDDDTVVVDTKYGCAYALDPIASFVWDGLLHGSTLSQIVDELAPEFDVPRAVIEADVSKLATDLGDLGMLAASLGEPVTAFDIDECATDSDSEARSAEPTFDDRYLAAPPNP